MLKAILLLALASPEAKPLKVTVTVEFAADAVILLELPVPEAGARYRRITVEQFRKHGKLISYLEYRLVELKLDGLIAKRAVFHLPDLPKPSPGSESVARNKDAP